MKKSRQKLKSIDEKFSMNSNHYLNITNANSSFTNRNYKYDYQTPNKINQNLYFEKPHKVLSNSTIQYQTTTNNNDISNVLNKNTGKAQSQKNYQKNKQVKNKPLYNNSFNDFYNKKLKSISDSNHEQV